MKLNVCCRRARRVEVGDRVADELLSGVTDPDHRATVEHRLPVDDAAPQQRPAPLGRALVGVELRAVPPSGSRRRRSTAPARTRTVDPDGPSNVAVAESSSLRTLDEAVSELDRVGADARPDGIEQDAMEFTTVDRELRPGVPSGAAPGSLQISRPFFAK